MLDIEVQIGDFVRPASWDDCQPQPESEAGLKIDAAPVTGVVSHDKARPSDLGHYLVADAADVILLIDAARLISRGMYSRFKSAEPCIVHTVVKPHGDEALWRTRSTRPQRLGGQQSLCCNSTRSSIQTERTFLDQNPYQEIDSTFIE